MFWSHLMQISVLVENFDFSQNFQKISILVKMFGKSWVTLYTAGHLHTAVPHCSHSRAPIVHTAVPRENNEHGCVYLRCRAVCKLPGCVEGHPWKSRFWSKFTKISILVKILKNLDFGQYFQKISISVEISKISILVEMFKKSRFESKVFKQS